MPASRQPSLSEPARHEPRRWMWWLALALITLAAAGLRAPQLHESLWLDELHTSWVVSDGLAEIPSRAAVGNQGSLYFGLVWISTKLFGHSEAALRLPSLIAGVLLVPAVFLLGRACGAGRAGAMAGSVFAALDPLAMYYALEARPYALLQFTAALQLTALAGVLRAARPGRRAAFIALSALMFHLHYTAALLLVAEGLLLGVYFFRARNRRYPLRAAGIDAAAILLLTIPAWGHIAEIAERRFLWQAFIPADDFELTLHGIAWDAYLLWPTALVCGILGWQYWANRGVKQKRTPHREEGPSEPVRSVWLVGLILAGAAAPGAIAWLATISDTARLFYPRYLVAVAPPLWAWTGVAAEAIRSPRLRLLAVIVATAGGVVGVAPEMNLLETGKVVARPREDWRGAIGWVNRSEEFAALPVVVLPDLIEQQWQAAPETELFREYLSFPLRGLYRLKTPERPFVARDFAGEPNGFANQLTELPTAEGVWLIVRGTSGRGQAAAAAMRRELEERHAGTVWQFEDRVFGEVVVVRIVPASTE